MKRRWLALGLLLLAVCGFALSLALPLDAKDSPGEAAMVFSVFTDREDAPQSADELGADAIVMLQRKFVCGSEEETIGIMTPEEIELLAAQHPEWEFAFSPDETVTFTEYVDDLSAHCKMNSYFGLDREGNLTLFEGPPKEERVVRTFFQLDIEHLESALPNTVVKQLREGIRVTDMAEYNSVLSTFSDYAVEETEKVMKPE